MVSFSTPKNPRMEYITFHVVDMIFPYNAIFGRGLLNTFEAALHSGYLCHKIAATFGVCSCFVCSSTSARNYQCSTSPGVFFRYRIYIFPWEEGSLSCLKLTQGITQTSTTRLYRSYVKKLNGHTLVTPGYG
jgi:hypothetical protein